jgi:sRNA-binding regulator protein Hfq
MPKEVFAEEIERFLRTVDGASAVRVLTTPTGEIAQIHVTAEDHVDSGTLKRGVVSALATRYGLPIEAWRIQIVQLRGGSRPAEIPQFRLGHVEETVAENETVATVQIAWTGADGPRTAVGRARGPSGAAYRMRTLAGATIDAVRGALGPAYRPVILEQVSLTTFLDRPAALVGVSLNTPRGPRTAIGAALEEDGLSDAVIVAVLDGVTKLLLQAARTPVNMPQAGDRRAQLDAMRHFMRAAERPGLLDAPERSDAAHTSAGGEGMAPETAAGDPESDAENPQAEPSARALIPSGTEALVGAVQGIVLALTPRPSRATVAQGGPGGTLSDDEDMLQDLNQIRPQEKGGSDMAVQQEPSRAGVVPPRAGRSSMEDSFYQGLVEARTPVHLRCRDGYEIPHATLRDVGTYTLLVDTRGGTELVFKHAIISIRLLTAPQEA